MKFGEPIRLECKNAKRKKKSTKKLVEKNQNIIGFLKQDEKIAEKTINENMDQAILDERGTAAKRRKLDGPLGELPVGDDGQII